MSAAPHILCLPLSHPGPDQKSHVLVAVTPTSESAGTQPRQSQSQALDLELVATDSIKAYVLPLHHGHLSKFRDASNDSCSEADWEDCLRALLLRDHPIGDVEATARTSDDGYLFIEIRNKVPGHTSKCGELKLRRSNKALASIDVFDWCAEAVGARGQLEKEVAELRRKHEDLQKLVAEETARFAELERSKHEFEEEHDSWLKDLLNEKKVKIRMQERILATAHVDQARLAAVTAPKRRAAAGPSRKGKRKAEPEGLDVQGGDTDGADEMDIDDVDSAPGGLEDLSDVGMATPGSETASASEPDADPVPEPQPKRSSRRGARESPASMTRTSKKAGKAQGEDSEVIADSEDDSAPVKPLPAHKKKPAALVDDESTESASD